MTKNKRKIKRLAVCVSGWHYPIEFYEAIAKQQVPRGWQIDLFVISHRDPKFAELPVCNDTRRGRLDKILYRRLATKEDLEQLGWTYHECPNTIGDWGNSNQWLEMYDYKEYDLFLFSHDDNLIIRDDLFYEVCIKQYRKKWLIMTNSAGMPPGSIRGSFEFFKKEMLDLIGGKFDLSETKLNREGATSNPKDWAELYDWNTTVYPLTDFLCQKGLFDKVVILSPFYRVSLYVIEGERGLIQNSQAFNNKSEEDGLNALEKYGMI